MMKVYLRGLLWRGKGANQTGASEILRIKKYLPPFTILTPVRAAKSAFSASMPLL